MEAVARLRLDSFVRVLAYWSQHADPDGAEDGAATARGGPWRLHLCQSFEGMWFGDLVLDPISGAVVSNQLRRIDSELFFDADWAEARSRLGEEATRRLHDRVGSDLPSPRGRAAWALLRSLAPTGVKLILVVAVAGGSVADEVGPGLADLRREDRLAGPSTVRTMVLRLGRLCGDEDTADRAAEWAESMEGGAIVGFEAATWTAISLLDRPSTRHAGARILDALWSS